MVCIGSQSDVERATKIVFWISLNRDNGKRPRWMKTGILHGSKRRP